MKMRKFLAMLLTLTLLLSIASPAFAVEAESEGSAVESGDTSSDSGSSDNNESSEPSESEETEPEESGDSGETTEPENPGETTEPENPGETTEPENPGETTDPENPGETTDPENPGETTDPENPGETTDPENPGETTDPENPGETTDPENPDQPEVPEDPDAEAKKDFLDQLGSAADKDAFNAILNGNKELYDKLTDEEKAELQAKLEALPDSGSPEEKPDEEAKKDFLDQLGSAADKDAFNEILEANRDLFDKLTEEEKAELLAKLETLPDAPAEDPDAEAKKDLFDKLNGAATKEDFEKLKEEFAELFDKLTEEERAALLAKLETLPTAGEKLEQEKKDLFDKLNGALTKEDFEKLKEEFAELFEQLTDEEKAALLAKLETLPTAEEKLEQEKQDLINRLNGASNKQEFLDILEANRELFEQLTEEQKAALMALLEGLPELPPVGDSLYERLMATETLEAFVAILNEATREEIDALYELSSAEKAALQEHLIRLMRLATANEIPFIPPVNFTDAGALLNIPVVKATAAPMRARRMNSRIAGEDPMQNPVAAGKENENMYTSKKLEEVNGQLQLTIEAYATGSYTSSEVVTSAPADIVLALDQSASMSGCMECGIPVSASIHDADGREFYTHQHPNLPTYAFPESILNSVVPESNRCSCEQFIPTSNELVDYGNGPEHVGFLGSYEDTSRQAVLKDAVNQFLAELAKSGENHRIGVVTYGGEAIGQGDGQTGIRRRLTEGTIDINGYLGEPHGATPTGRAMEYAKALFDEVKASSEGRKKVVILFTDGYPTADQDTGYFVREEPRPEFNPDAYREFANDALRHAGALKNDGVDIYTIGVFSRADGKSFPSYVPVNENAGPNDENELARANRFMQMLSSNCGAANYLGADVSCDLSKSHYLSPENADALIDAFIKISDSITGSTSNVSLGATVVRDVISPYFEVDRAAGGVKAYDVSIENGKEISSTPINASLNDGVYGDNAIQTVEAEYNFNENFLLDGKGHKLRIVIPIKERDGFWGGNNVPTNIPRLSGVFTDLDDDQSPETCIKALHSDFKSTELAYPKANVQIKIPEWKPKDKNIYYGNATLVLEDLFEIGNVPVDWRTDYLNNEPQITLRDGQTIQFEEDEKYNLDFTFTAAETPEPASKGAPAVHKGGQCDALVNVFKPTVSFADMRTYLTVVADVEHHMPKSVVWTHNGNVVTNSGSEGSTIQVSETDTTLLTYGGENATMEGTAPTLTCTIKGRVNALHGADVNQAVRDYYAFVTKVEFSNGKTVETRDDQGAAKEQNVVTFSHHVCEDIVSRVYDSKVGEFLVHVFKPEITFTDMSVYKGMTKDDVTYAGPVKVEWMYPGEIKNGAELEMPSSPAPVITYEYTPRNNDLYNGNYFVKDTPVQVQAAVGGHMQYTPAGVTAARNINACIIFKWEHDCGLLEPDKIEAEGTVKGHQFYVHVIPCQLTVTKSVSKFYDQGDSFLFHIRGSGNPLAAAVDMDVFLSQEHDFSGVTASKIIGGLPVGTYTVTEDTNWSWRYKLDSAPGAVTLSETNSEGSVSFHNTLVNENWLSGGDAAVNTFITVNAAKTLDARTGDAWNGGKQDENFGTGTDTDGDTANG
ncbi:VWA domain-containing protein [uncultured Oscillibacter sp.]|uniref:VWA domain-containing protein n=1 Tax=uncultured Oscillibacter sp. TaxID=876091 RepID=UPI0025EEF45B|nr:VWA domain-containing protein [uncultured Oscillibacter sp.]